MKCIHQQGTWILDHSFFPLRCSFRFTLVSRFSFRAELAGSSSIVHHVLKVPLGQAEKEGLVKFRRGDKRKKYNPGEAVIIDINDIPDLPEKPKRKKKVKKTKKKNKRGSCCKRLFFCCSRKKDNLEEYDAETTDSSDSSDESSLDEEAKNLLEYPEEAMTNNISHDKVKFEMPEMLRTQLTIASNSLPRQNLIGYLIANLSKT